MLLIHTFLPKAVICNKWLRTGRRGGDSPGEVISNSGSWWPLMCMGESDDIWHVSRTLAPCLEPWSVDILEPDISSGGTPVLSSALASMSQLLPGSSGKQLRAIQQNFFSMARASEVCSELQRRPQKAKRAWEESRKTAEQWHPCEVWSRGELSMGGLRLQTCCPPNAGGWSHAQRCWGAWVEEDRLGRQGRLVNG